MGRVSDAASASRAADPISHIPLLLRLQVPGVIVWWTRALVDEDEVDSATFPDRRRQAKAEEHQRVWSEAQRIFREKAKGGRLQDTDRPRRRRRGGDGDGDGMEDDGGSSGPSVRRADERTAARATPPIWQRWTRAGARSKR